MLTIPVAVSVALVLILWFRVFPAISRAFDRALPPRSITLTAGEWHNERFKTDPEYYRKLEATAVRLGYQYSDYYMELHRAATVPGHQIPSPQFIAEMRKIGLYAQY